MGVKSIQRLFAHLVGLLLRGVISGSQVWRHSPVQLVGTFDSDVSVFMPSASLKISVLSMSINDGR